MNVFQEHVVKMDENVTNHQAHSDSYRQCSDWLKVAMEKLESCVDGAGDKALMQERQEALAVSHISFLATILLTIILLQSLFNIEKNYSFYTLSCILISYYSCTV